MNLQVETNYGYVKGIPAKGHADVAAFIGVPYAREYTRRFRFQSAKPAERWKGIKLCDGVQPGQIAVNIWTPALKNESGPMEQIPVILFIPGFMGLRDDPLNAPYNGAALAEAQHVVVCSITYRTAAFGFLDLSSIDPKFEANVGIKDQLLAIQWVYENIEYFGGDKENITLAGSGEGGGDVMKLIAIPEVMPYIARAFVTSPRYIDVIDRAGAKELARDYLKKLKVSEDNLDSLLEMSPESLIIPFVFKVVVDGVFIAKDPICALESPKGGGNSIPLMVVIPENDVLFEKECQDIVSEKDPDRLDEKKALKRYLDSYVKTSQLNLKEFDYTSIYLKTSGRKFTNDFDTALFFGNPDCVYVSSAMPLLFNRRRASKMSERCTEELGEYLRGMSFSLKPYEK